MKKFIVLMIVLWGLGGCGVWYWAEARTQRVSYRTVAIKRGDVRFDDQRDRDDRTRGGRRRRAPRWPGGSRASPPTPRPEQDGQLWLARRARDGARPDRRCTVPGAARPGTRPRHQGRGRHRAGRGQVPAGRPRDRSVSQTHGPRDDRTPRNTTRPWRTTSRPRPRSPLMKPR